MKKRAVYFEENNTRVVNTVAVSRKDAKTMRAVAKKFEGITLASTSDPRRATDRYLAAVEARYKGKVNCEVVESAIGRLLMENGRVLRITAYSKEGEARELMKQFDNSFRLKSLQDPDGNARLLGNVPIYPF